MKIYKFCCYNTKKGYTLEEAYFTSLKKALQSLDVVAKHLVWNHNLNPEDNIDSEGFISDIRKILIVGGEFKLSIIEHKLKTKALCY